MTEPIAEAVEWVDDDDVVEAAPRARRRRTPDGPITLPDGGVLYPPDDPLLPTDMRITEVAPVEYVIDPYGPKGAVVFLAGATGSSKSVVGQSWGSALTRQGLPIAYYDGELPEAVAKSRMHRLGADLDLLRYFHRPGLDFENPVDRARILYACHGCAAVFFDTLSSFFFAEEGDNPAFVRVYQTLLAPLADMGMTVFVLDHSGVPSSANPRKGVHILRGQSAKAQKADVVIHAEANGPKAFSLNIVKASRYVTDDEPKAYFRVRDTEDGGLEVAPEGQVAGHSRQAVELADRMVDAIVAAGPEGITATDLQTALGCGRPTYRAASALLELEESPRVRQVRTSKRSASNGRDYPAWRWFPIGSVPTLDEVSS